MVSISNTKTVTGSHNIVLQADVLFEEADYSKMDLLVLPGGMPGTLHLGEHTGLCRLLQDFAAEGKKVAAICAAPSVLGALGILKEKKAVCYPGFEEKTYRRPGGDAGGSKRMEYYHQQRSGHSHSLCIGVDFPALRGRKSPEIQKSIISEKIYKNFRENPVEIGGYEKKHWRFPNPCAILC